MTKKYETLTVYGLDVDTALAKTYAKPIEEGRWIARDLCGADPEVITPTKFVEYMKAKFLPGKGIDVTYEDINEATHPMMAAVERANKGKLDFFDKYKDILLHRCFFRN